mmetsp:Transcript_40955/g.92347  ORF Transcript_40955/g.92347 Transcript_40955/m.92347 type:complete len:520 (+) Transcript_40955:73-1632(+)
MRVLVPVLAAAQPGCRMVQEIPEAGLGVTNETIAAVHARCSTVGIEECDEMPGCMWSATNSTCGVGEPLDIACGAAMTAGRDCDAQTACPAALCVTWKEANEACGNQTIEASCQDQDSCIWVNATCGVDATALVHDFESRMMGGPEGLAGAIESQQSDGPGDDGDDDDDDKEEAHDDDEQDTEHSDDGGDDDGEKQGDDRRLDGDDEGDDHDDEHDDDQDDVDHSSQSSSVDRQSTDPCFAMAGMDENKCGAMGAFGLSCRYNSAVERSSGLSTVRGELEMRLGTVESGTLEALTVEDHVAVADAVGAVLQQEMLEAGWNISGQVEVSWTWELESRRLQGSSSSVEIEVDYSVSVHSPVSKEDYQRVDQSRAQAGIQTALRETKGMEGAEVLEMEMEVPEEVEGDDEDEEHEEEDRDHGFGGLAMLAGCAVGALVLGGAGVFFGRKFYCKGKPLAKADSETMGIPADADHEAGAEVKPVDTVVEPAAHTGTDSKEDNKADVACDCSTASGSVPEGTQEV